MARYLDPTGTKFWEIERDGATIVRKSGKLGSKGRAQKHAYASPLHARYEYGSIVGRKTHTEKYVAEAPDPEKPADDFPFDDEARLVHGDLLQSRGDPLGELIAMQHAQAETQDFQQSQKLQREIDELLDANAPKWFGDLWQERDLLEWEWRLGRLKRVKLADDHIEWKVRIARILPDVPLCYLLGAFLDALFDLDIARSLEELELGTAGTYEMQDTSVTLSRLAPPTLRRLEITRGRGRLASAEYGLSLHTLQLPGLEEFRCNIDLDAGSLDVVARADLPKLHTLCFATSGYHDPAAQYAGTPSEIVAALAPILEKPLRELEIRTAQPTEVARAIIDAGALANAGELVIRSKRVMDAGTEAELKRFNPNASYIQMPMYSMRPD